jgi:hypothetical protein
LTFIAFYLRLRRLAQLFQIFGEGMMNTSRALAGLHHALRAKRAALARNVMLS